MYTIRATYIPRENMQFDKAYYVNHHIPLVQKLLAGRVHYLQMYAEFDTQILMNGNEARSPGVFVLLVESIEEVENFRAFRRSEDVKLLYDDIKNYTNCISEWTFAEVAA